MLWEWQNNESGKWCSDHSQENLPGPSKLLPTDYLCILLQSSPTLERGKKPKPLWDNSAMNWHTGIEALLPGPWDIQEFRICSFFIFNICFRKIQSTFVVTRKREGEMSQTFSKIQRLSNAFLSSISFCRDIWSSASVLSNPSCIFWVRNGSCGGQTPSFPLHPWYPEHLGLIQTYCYVLIKPTTKTVERLGAMSDVMWK